MLIAVMHKEPWPDVHLHLPATDIQRFIPLKKILILSYENEFYTNLS